MITYFTKFLYFYFKNAYLINKLIFDQSRNKELYLVLGLEDNFQNRLNLQILHLSLILLNLNIYKNKYYVEKKLGWLIRESKVKQNFLYKFIGNLIKNKKLLSQKKKNMNKFHKK